MTCPEQDALYRYPWPGQTQRERQDLRAHCSGCASCSAVISRLESARRVLVAEAPEFGPFRQQATWRAIEAQTSQEKLQGRRPWLWAAVAVSAAVLFFVAGQASTPAHYVLASGEVQGMSLGEVPLGRALVVRQDARIEAPDLEIEAVKGGRLSLEPKGILRLSAGRLMVARHGSNAELRTQVQTPHAVLSTVGAQFTVEVGAQTKVQVQQGGLRIEAGTAEPVHLVAAQSWSSPGPAEPSAPPSETRQALTRARALVRHDAEGARRVAKAVLDGAIEARDEVDALAVIADAHRRSGEPRQAAAYYARVAEHRAGAAYAEEALLRRARMLLQVRDYDGALHALAAAKRRYSTGDLAPERCAAEAQVWLTSTRTLRAADVVERCPGASLSVQDVRRAVAGALQATHPDRARALMQQIEK